MNLRRMFRSITVEPALFVFMVGCFMEYGVYQALIYSKLCLQHYNHSREICHDPKDEVLSYVQNQTSYWLQYNNIALLVPSIISACYLGAWGDRYGRKVPILLATLSTLFGYLIFLVISYYEDSPIYLTLLANFVSGVGGGYLMIVAAMMSYVADISCSESRTTRVAVLESMTSLGSFFGPFISGFLLEGAGYAYTFLFCVCCNAVVIVYLVVRLENVIPRPREALTESTDSLQSESEIVKTDLSPTMMENESGVICRMGYVYEGFKVCFYQREGWKRFYVIALMFSCLCVFMASNAESSLTYLYVKNDPLKFSYKKYSQYSSLKNALSAVMLLITLPTLRRFFNLKDTTLVFIGLGSRAAGLVLLAVSTTTAMIFLVPEVAIFGMYPVPCMRAMLSKIVEPSEQGKMFSALATVESITEIFASVVYSNFYPLTRSFFSGFCFIFAVIFLLPPLVIMSWMHWQNARISRRQSVDTEINQ